MTDAAGKATYEDLMQIPEDVRAEIIGGRILVQGAPRPRHNHFVFRLGAELDRAGPGSPDGGWWIVGDVDVRLSTHDIVRPDLAGWRKERLPALPDDPPIDLRPDWVCEVLSPSNAVHDRKRKAALYATAGVPHLWLVDPVERLLEAYAGRDGQWLQLGVWSDGDRVGVPPFEEVELVVGGLFAPVAPPRGA